MFDIAKEFFLKIGIVRHIMPLKENKHELVRTVHYGGGNVP
jgi:hypothetical protein